MSAPSLSEPKVNVALLRDVADHILAHPESLEMGAWIEKRPCGTVGCIAGWAMLLSRAQVPDEFFGIYAGQVLGLTTEQEHALFFISGWPSPFHLEYWRTGHIEDYAAVLRKRAEVTARRIQHFIDTGE